MPRSRSISIVSSTCSRISRASSPPQAWMSRSARVDLPWSIWAMIAKLRIWLSGVVIGLLRMPPEHKDARPPDQRGPPRRARLSRCCCRNFERPCGGEQPVIVARKLDSIALSAQEIDRGKMERIECANRHRPGLQSAGENRFGQLDQSHSRKKRSGGFAKQCSEAMTVYAGPNLVFKQLTRHERLRPKGVGRHASL